MRRTETNFARYTHSPHHGHRHTVHRRSRHPRRRSVPNTGSTTKLADWGGVTGAGGITKLTEMSQSQHRLDSLSRLDAVLLTQGPVEVS
ncbi:hypothetical protein PG994_013711 [Apiospora phragmitis]|uniref:Uncharacterized protein n=1 Tax=Apiospora phragmitis TaxID=2905665 RepID=A0ABR1T9F3_9PEZI